MLFDKSKMYEEIKKISKIVDEKGVKEAAKEIGNTTILATASQARAASTNSTVNSPDNVSNVLPVARTNAYRLTTGKLQNRAKNYIESDRYAEVLAKREKERLANELKKKRYELENKYKEIREWQNSVGGQGKYLDPDNWNKKEEEAKSIKTEIELINNDLLEYDTPSALKKALFTPVEAGSRILQGALSLPEGIADLGTHVIAQVEDLKGNEEYADKLRKSAQKNVVSDKWFGKSNKYFDKNSYSNDTWDSIFQGVGYSLPIGIISKTIPGAGEVMSDVLLGASAMGSELNEAYSNENISDKKAWTKAASSAALEVGVEKLFGVLGYGGSSIEDAIMNSTNKIKNGLVKAIAQTGVSMTGEGTEELLSYAGNYLIDHGLDFVDKSSKIGQEWDNEELWESFFVGAMSAGVAQTPVNLINYKTTQKANNNNISQTGINNNQNDLNNVLEENKVSAEKLPVAREESKNIANQNLQIEENTSNNLQDMQVQKEVQQNSNIAPYNNEKYVAEDVKAKMQQVVDSANKINKSDVKLEFTQLDGNKKAQTDGNNIKIDISKANLGDVIHEITHNTENSKGYLALSDYILTELDKRGELQSIKEQMNTVYSSIYEQEGRIFTEKDLENEIVANYTEKFANDENFVDKITKTDRNFAQKIYDWIKEKVNYYKTVRNMTDEQRAQYDELKRAERLWMKALKENNNESLSNNKYKIFENDKGKYVKADRQVITGKNPQIWKKQTENYINEQIRKGKDIIFYSEDGTPLTISKNTAGKATFRNDVKTKENTYRKMTDEEFKSKLQAEVHIDELSQISKHKAGPVPDTKNHIFARDGFSYRTAYFEDGNGQYYRVTMSIGQNGEINTIYNIGKMDKKSRSNSSLTAQRPSRNKSTEATPSTNSITFKTKDVNTTKYSIQESENNSSSFNLTKKDNKGRNLTKEQQEYFKDSKIRDESGNLLTLYHGSDSEFTIFDTKKSGQASKESKVGFWFTETKDGAEKFANSLRYGNKNAKAYETYLNIKNPKVYNTIDNSIELKKIDNRIDELKNIIRKLENKNIAIEINKQELKWATSKEAIQDIAKYEGIDYDDAKQYHDTLEEYKQLEEEYDNKKYNDSYEQFRSDIYSIAGKSASNANFRWHRYVVRE